MAIGKLKLKKPVSLQNNMQSNMIEEGSFDSSAQNAGSDPSFSSSNPGAEGGAVFNVFFDNKLEGPFTRETIIDWCRNGQLSAGAMIQCGQGDWISLNDVDWLQEVLHGQPQGGYESTAGYDDSPLVSCPHCWHKFHMNDILYVSKSPGLLGDPVLGESAQARFVPTSFNEMGYALDADGYVCPEMACPRCHLKIPESFFNVPTNLFSVVGAPSSGKSYFLTAMVWMLRNVLPKKFNCTLTDPDTTFNLVLNNYEQTLYLNQNQGSLVALPKTELQGGDFSNQIMLNGISVDLPLPYIFGLVPTSANMIMDSQRNVVFYDNAGEHFEPGRDNIANLATQHLALSEGIIYVYDPIKDPRMSVNCDPDDPQVARRIQGTSQIVLINEMISRIRKYTGMKSTEKYDKSLVVVMHKYDAWKSMFPIDLSGLDYSIYSDEDMCWKVNMGNIKLVSFLMREILLNVSPDIVAVTESFFNEVYFIPVSSLGHIPEFDPEHDSVSVRAGTLSPIWAEVPVLIQFSKSGLVPADNLIRLQEGASVVEIEKYKFRNGAVIFTCPGTQEPVVVPQTYFGCVVYSTKASCFLRIPQPTEPEEPGPAGQTAQAESDTEAFWNN